MALRVLRQGSPVVVVYHLGAAADVDVLAALPGHVGVVNQTYPGFKDHYTHFADDAIAPLAEVLAAAGAAEGSAVALVGFSEGCQGVRTQLRAGVVPIATLAVDGIHTKPEPWRALAERARRSEVALTITHSSINPGTYPSTTQMAAQILAPAAEHPATDDSQGPYPLISAYEDGDFRVFGYAGSDAPAHIFQGRVVLPRELGHLAPWLTEGARAPSTGWPWWTKIALALGIGGAIAGAAAAARR